MAIRSAAGKSDGVPPPKKTVFSFLGATFDCCKILPERMISPISVAAKSLCFRVPSSLEV